MTDEAASRGLLATFQRRWHRAYLDTAELNDISRGRGDKILLNDVLAAFKEHAVILVVSIEHLRDALKPGDVDAPGRFADALEMFPLLGLVSVGPDAIEPWRDGPADITIEPCGNVREVLTAPAAAPILSTQGQIQEATFAGESAANIALRETHAIRHPRHHQGVVVGATVTLMRGWMGHDVGVIVDMHADKEGLHLSSNERAALIDVLRPVVEFVRHAGPLMDEHGVDRTESLRLVGLGPERAPGFWLGGKLVTNRMRNVTRSPTRSDSIDVLHAQYFPYVDIATCDRQTFEAVAQFVAQARGSRAVSLRRNGQLREVLEDAQRLPTGAELVAGSV